MWLVLERFSVETSDVSYAVEIKAVHPPWVSMDKHGLRVAFLSGMSCSVHVEAEHLWVKHLDVLPSLTLVTPAVSGPGPPDQSITIVVACNFYTNQSAGQHCTMET